MTDEERSAVRSMMQRVRGAYMEVDFIRVTYPALAEAIQAEEHEKALMRQFDELAYALEQAGYYDDR